MNSFSVERVGPKQTIELVWHRPGRNKEKLILESDFGMKKNLHIGMLDKFIPPFVRFINEHFNIAEHDFRLFGDTVRYPVEFQINNQYSGENKIRQLVSCVQLAVAMHKAKKIVLHGLFLPDVIIILWLMPWLLRKCYWLIWGGDLYCYLDNSDRNLTRKEFFRRRVIKKMGHLVTYVKGDVDLVRHWYGTRGEYHECFMYPSNLCKAYDVPPRTGASINILIGNSADPSNEHFEMLSMLAPFRDEDIKIYAPLSYGHGHEEHARRVTVEGTRLFGDKFVPMSEFLPFEEYLKFLGDIDIAIFNHRRQQAMGNIITLLGLGKTVFLRENTTHWNFFQDKGFLVSKTDNFSLATLDKKDKNSNKRRTETIFSEQELIRQYNTIFYS